MQVTWREFRRCVGEGRILQSWGLYRYLEILQGRVGVGLSSLVS